MQECIHTNTDILPTKYETEHKKHGEINELKNINFYV